MKAILSILVAMSFSNAFAAKSKSENSAIEMVNNSYIRATTGKSEDTNGNVLLACGMKKDGGGEGLSYSSASSGSGFTRQSK